MTAGSLDLPHDRASAAGIAGRESLLGRIAAFEWKLLRAERTLVPLGILTAMALAYAAFNGRAWTTFQQQAATEAVQDERDRLSRLSLSLDSLRLDTGALKPFGDPRSPYAASNGRARRFAILPRAPLAPLAVGQSDLFPAYYRVSMTSRETFLANDEVENPSNLVSGRFDLAFLIVSIFPLLVIALTYNLLSSEREGGTLALLGAQPVALRRILTGKVLARGGVIVTLAVVLSVVGALLAGADLGAPGSLARLTLWSAVAAAYGLFWLAAAVLVNVRGASSSTNALALLGLWLAMVVLVPSILSVAVTAAHPVPSRVELMTATREASNAASARGSQLLAMYFQDHPELMTGGPPNMNDFATRSIAVAEEVAKAVRPITARFDSALTAQQRLVDRWRFVSPAVATHDALTVLAGTDTERYRDFQRQVDAYIASLKGYYLPLITSSTRLDAARLAAVPAFAYVEPRGSAAFSRAFSAAASVVALTLLIAWVSVRRFGRLRVAER